MSTRSPVPAAAARPQRELAFVKLMRGNGFAGVDVHEERYLGTVGDGQHPHGLAVHPSGRWAYLAFAGSGTVEVVDTARMDVVARSSSVGIAPIGSECSRDGRHLFVTAYGRLPTVDEPGLTVMRTNARTGGTLEAMGHHPIGKCAGVVLDVSGNLWIALKDADELVRVNDPASFTVTDRIPMPGDPQDVVYAPTYELLGVNNVEDGSVAFLDSRTGRTLEIVDAPNPRSGAISPMADRWFVADTEGDGVTVIDIGGAVPTVDDRVTLETPTAFVDVTPGGEYVVIDAYEDDRVTFLDAHSLDVLARVETGETPRHPRFSADGQRCYVANVDDDSVAILDTAPLYEGESPTVRRRIELPADSAPSSCYLIERAGRGTYS